MTQQETTNSSGFREWTLDNADLPTIELLPYDFSWTLRQYDNDEGSVFLEFNIEAANEIYAVPIPKRFKTKDAALEYIRATSLGLHSEYWKCAWDVIHVRENGKVIETIPNTEVEEAPAWVSQ
jgi:hypothetical protein